VADPETWAECRRQAELVISDCIGSLRAGYVVHSTTYAPLASVLGVMCADRGVHLMEPVRALSELFEAVSDALTDILDGDPDQARQQQLVLRALNRATSSLIEVVLGRYDSTLADLIDQARLGDRRRLARDIHDWLGNSISLAIRHLDLYEIYRDRGQSTANWQVDEMRHALDDVLSGARRLVSELRQQCPVADLGDALRAYLRSVAPSDTAVDVVVRGDEALVPGRYRDELFVVVRECLRNAFAHARAARVDARVVITQTEIFAAVEDDGVGLDSDAPRQGGAGLVCMRERVELLGGELCVATRRGVGTRVQIWVPLPERS
jgi:signal transduction histidine kinase